VPDAPAAAPPDVPQAGTGAALRRALGWPLRRLLDRRVEWIIAALDERLGSGPGRVSLHQRLAQIEGYLADGPGGPAARAGLWFNPPVPVRNGPDGAEVLLVNERIVEQPYVFAALAGVSGPLRVLDVGGGESTVALSLASLGHEVHIVDPRGYGLAHPRLQVHAVRLDELPAGPPFQAVVALSAIEHFGLGSYGQDDAAQRLDQAALSDIRERLAPGGRLILTVPCGREGSVDDFQRVYTPAELRVMLGSWELDDFTLVWQRDRLTWERAAADAPPAERGVALITAHVPD
jgi:SAM-dependent methyltransferase